MLESHQQTCYLILPTLFLGILTLCQSNLCRLHYVLCTMYAQTYICVLATGLSFLY